MTTARYHRALSQGKAQVVQISLGRPNQLYTCKNLHANWRKRRMSEEEIEQLRRELHVQVDALCNGHPTGIEIELASLQLAGRLFVAAQDWIDLQIGREFSDAALRDPKEALRLGNEKRNLVKAASYQVDGQTPETTAEIGRIGALVGIRWLATFADDPYLKQLTKALERVRHGQPHPWLTPPRPKIHPPKLAHSVLQLRGISFAVIEYLVASGL